MGIDLLAPFVRAPAKPMAGAIVAGEAVNGRMQPRDYRAMVRADNDWVYRCSRVNAENVAKVCLRLYRRSTGEEVTEHPFLDLMRTVREGANRFDTLEMTELFLEVIGNSYWYLAPTRLANPRTGALVPGEIWVLMAQHVTIVPGTARMVDGYLYQVPGGVRVAFLPEEIVHFKFPCLDSLYYGKGPVEGGRFAINTHTKMAEYEAALFENMARPDGALSTEKDLTTPQITQLRNEWQRIHGGTKRSGNIAILQRGLKYEAMGTTPKDLDYLHGKEFTREQIAAMFGVPLSKLGIEVAADRAAAEAHDLTYQKETIQPRLTRLQEKINEGILVRYDEDLEAKFDDPVPANNEFALKKRDSDLDRGVIVINEVREEEGKEDVAWGDEPYSKPVSLGGFGADGAQDPTAENPKPTPKPKPPKDENQDDEADKAVREAVARSRTPGHWERFIAATLPLERTTRRAMRSYFLEQRRTVEANLERARGKSARGKAVDPFVASILFPMEAEKARLVELATPLIEQAVTLGAVFGSEGLTALDFDVLNPLTTAAVKERVAFFARRINQETARALTDAIVAGLEAGESTLQISDRIGDVYEQAIGFRAIRIARTEVLSASNRGAVLAYEAGGIEEKRWVTAGDEEVRDSHRAANGQVRGVHQRFHVGAAQLDHPGDPDGPAGEIINCRCTTVAVIRA